jgi:uncharacterized protein YegJ (DUF2314 family)
MAFPRKLPALLASLAALFSAGLTTTHAAQRKPGDVVPAGDVRSDNGFYAVVFYYTPDPKTDPLATARALAKEYLPGVEVLTDIPQGATTPLIGFQEEKAPLEEFPVPEAGYFKFAGRGMTDADVTAIQKTSCAVCIVFVMPRDSAWTNGRRFTELVQKFAERTGAFIWDSATRECFSRDAWKTRRLDKWPEKGIPDIPSQITIHLYRPDDSTQYVRAITLGMEKFALPDMVIEQLVGSDNRPAGNLINLVCQSLAEHPQLASGAKERFQLASLQAGDFSKKMKSGLDKEATGEIELELLEARHQDGDADNRLVEISFANGEGKTVDERRNDQLSKLWGAHDAVTKVKHNDEILAASARARERLKEIKKDFDKGLKPGERLLVKAPFKRDDGGNEWMWVEVMKWPPDGTIDGVLQNDPFFIEGLRAGAKVRVNVDELFDYIFHRADGTTEGNETGALIEKQGVETQEK